jgi:hypothetical protein
MNRKVDNGSVHYVIKIESKEELLTVANKTIIKNRYNRVIEV